MREKVGTMKPVRIAPGNPQPCPGGMAAGLHFRNKHCDHKKIEGRMRFIAAGSSAKS